MELLQTKLAQICFFCNKKYQIPDTWAAEDTPQTEPIEDDDSSDSSSGDDNDTASEAEAQRLPQQ